MSALIAPAPATPAAPAHDAKLVPPGAGRAIDFPLHPIAEAVAPGDLPSGLAAYALELPARSPGAPPHRHAEEDEIYVVVSGEMTFLMGQEVVTAGPGAVVSLPRGGLHGWWNESDRPAGAVMVLSPDTAFAGFFDRVVARLAAEGAGDAPGVVAEIAAALGVEIEMAALPARARPLFGLG